MKRFVTMMMCLTLCLVLTSCVFADDFLTSDRGGGGTEFNSEYNDSLDKPDNNDLVEIDQMDDQDQTEQDSIPPDPIEIKISAVGDIMVHGPQVKAAYDPDTDEYDFKHNFQFIQPYIERADLALANFESTFAGESREFSGYPTFNTPDEMALAIEEAGFDVIATANNHTLDTGKDGFFRTIEVLEDHDLKIVGTRADVDTESYVIEDVEGIQVGVSAYTYETPRQGDQKSLNGINMPTELEDLIDSFSYSHLEEDLEIMKDRIEKMRSQGAELIIFYMHWGDEYQRQPNAYQEKIAQVLCNSGVDIIFGSHPHVIQPIEMYESENDDHQTAVIYSMGNFISNQRYERLDNRYTEDGIIINVNVVKDFESETVSLDDITYMPTWVHLYEQDSQSTYEIVPVEDALSHPETFNLESEESVWRTENSKENTVSNVESSISALQIASSLDDEEIEVIQVE